MNFGGVKALGVIAFTLTFVASCGPAGQDYQFLQTEIHPEESCNFFKNSHDQRVSWSGRKLEIYFHESVPAQFQDATFRAMRHWEDALGRELFDYKGVIGGPNRPAQDGVSVLYYLPSWDPSRRGEQARTTIFWNGKWIREADVFVNAQDFAFGADSSQPESGKVDWESLLVHEFGHALGLRHIEDRDSVMYAYLGSGQIRTDVDDRSLASMRCEY